MGLPKILVFRLSISIFGKHKPIFVIVKKTFAEMSTPFGFIFMKITQLKSYLVKTDELFTLLWIINQIKTISAFWYFNKSTHQLICMLVTLKEY